MDDLAAWMRATVSVVQRAAERAAEDGNRPVWPYPKWPYSSSGIGSPIFLIARVPALDQVVVEHLVLNDPRAVLLQCVADTAFLDRYERASTENHHPDTYGLADDLLRARGLAWSFMPGYRESWRP